MNFLNMIDMQKEHRASKALEKNISRQDNRFSIYESLEFIKNNNKDISFKLEMEMYRAFLR